MERNGTRGRFLSLEAVHYGGPQTPFNREGIKANGIERKEEKRKNHQYRKKRKTRKTKKAKIDAESRGEGPNILLLHRKPQPATPNNTGG